MNLIVRCIFFGVGMACIQRLIGIESFTADFWLFIIGGACLWNAIPSAKNED